MQLWTLRNSAVVGTAPALISITRGTPSLATKQASCVTETVLGIDDELIPNFKRAAFWAAVSTKGVLVATVVVAVVVVATGVVVAGVTTGTVLVLVTGGVTTGTLPALGHKKYAPIPITSIIIIAIKTPFDDLFIPICRPSR